MSDSWSQSLLAEKNKAKHAMLAASKTLDAPVAKRKAAASSSSATGAASAPVPGSAKTARTADGAAGSAQAPAQHQHQHQHQQQAAGAPRMPRVLMNSRAEAAVAMAQAQTSSDMYKVLEQLKKMGVEQPQTVEQLEAACNLRIRTNADLLNAMKNNAFMTLENSLWSYKPKHNIRSKEQLLAFVKSQQYREAVPRKELNNSFSGFDHALQELIASQDIISLQYGKDKEFLFYNDPTIAVRTDKALCEEWAAIAMPTDDRAIAKELERSGQRVFRVIEAIDDEEEINKKKALVYKKRITRGDRVRKQHMLDSGNMNLAPSSDAPTF